MLLYKAVYKFCIQSFKVLWATSGNNYKRIKMSNSTKKIQHRLIGSINQQHPKFRLNWDIAIASKGSLEEVFIPYK